MKKYNIYGILFLALLLRLYHISFPIAGWHSWRQSDTAAMSRNFYENGYNLLYPQIDWGGNTPGYVESEFPIYQFAVSILYKLFSTDVLWGRLLSVIFSIATIYGLYLLVKKIISEKTALWATFIYAIIPLNIFYGRSFMPESAMLMSSVWGLYWFSRWTESNAVRHFILAAIFVAMAALLKIPSLYLLLPLFYLAKLHLQKNVFKTKDIWLFALIVILPVFGWYFHAHQIAIGSGLTFGIWGFGGSHKWGNFDTIVTLKFYNDVFFKSIAERHLTYIGFIFFVIGLFIKRKSKEEKFFDYWLIAVIIYFVIVAKGNQVHEYYQLPFILPAVVFVGKAFDKYLDIDYIYESFLNKPIAASLVILSLLGIFTLSYLRYERFMNSESYNTSLFELASAVQKKTRRNELIVTVSGGNPVILYLCDRKGWNSATTDLDSLFLGNKVKMGAKYLVGQKQSFQTIEEAKMLEYVCKKYNSIVDTPDYFILRLE